jgi:hypothetical protein
VQSVATESNPLSMQLPAPSQVSWILHCDPATPQAVPGAAKFDWQIPSAPQVSDALHVVEVGSPHASPVAITVAAVVAALETQPFTVTVTLYVPVAAGVAPTIDGFWSCELKPGPVQV